MSEIQLRQPGFIYKACGPLTKMKERIKIEINKRFKIYLSKQIRSTLLLVWYNLWKF